MTQAEYTAAKKQKYQEYKKGLITNYAYIQWKKKNDPSLPGNSGAQSAAAAGGGKTSDGANTAGQLAADAAEQKIEKDLKKVYSQAKKEMQAKLQEMAKEYGEKYQEKLKDLAAGKITQEQFDAWGAAQVQQLEIWQKKIDQCTDVMLHANEKAVSIVNGETMNVFAENANFQSYQITQDTGMNLSFAVYDEKTVEKLIKQRPELLPRKVVNGKKDKAWNRTKIANAVTQGIIQGESIPDLANRIARDTASMNGSAMVRYARTAMTSAQNAGRMEGLHRAKEMGVKVKKKWLATLDSSTRDTHAALDGQTAEVDKPFVVDGMEIMFPGDPSADPSLVYNCRCTLVYEYEGYPADPTADERRDNETGEVITNMDYKEWKAAKENSELNSLNAAKINLAEAQKALISGKVDPGKVYSNIWKDDVTLADYPEKKGSIQAKRDYYETEIQKLKDAQANGESWATDEKLKDKQKQLKLLNEFEKKGKLLETKTKAQQELQTLYDKIGVQKTATAPDIAQKAANKAKKAAASSGGTTAGTDVRTGAEGGEKTPFGPDAYSQERKDKALWAKRPQEADGYLRAKAGEVWNKATQDEKYAIYDYTGSYHKFNEPLRGIEYGTSRKLGVGNTDLNAGRANNGNELNAMTDIIARSTYDEDVWLQRGCKYDGMDDFFNIPMSLLQNGSQEELEQALLGTTPIEYGFMSCGSNKGSGLNVNQPGGILLNIYAPSGTQMMYVEPFSQYGGESKGMSWDGKSGQTHFGQEVETLVNQGTQFRVLKVERKGRTGKIYVDLEIINQDHQQRWKPKR